MGHRSVAFIGEAAALQFAPIMRRAQATHSLNRFS